MPCSRSVAFCLASISAIHCVSGSQLRSETSPSLKVALEKPPAPSIKDISASLAAFQDSVQTRWSEADEEVKSVRARFDKKLEPIRNEIAAIEEHNHELEVRTAELKVGNKKLREQGDVLMRDSRTLIDDITALQGNLSTANEVLSGAVDEGSQLLSANTSREILVLEELVGRDAAETQRLEHERKLSEVSSRQRPALLQVATSLTPDEADLLQSLNASLSTFGQEHQASIKDVEAAFNTTLHNLTAMKASLLEEQAKLESSKAEVEELNKKLLVSVEHLQATQHRLVQQSRSLRAFAKILGGGNVAAKAESSDSATPEKSGPVSMLRVAKKAPSKATKKAVAKAGTSAKTKEKKLRGYSKHHKTVAAATKL